MTSIWIILNLTVWALNLLGILPVEPQIDIAPIINIPSPPPHDMFIEFLRNGGVMPDSGYNATAIDNLLNLAEQRNIVGNRFQNEELNRLRIEVMNLDRVQARILALEEDGQWEEESEAFDLDLPNRLN